MKKKKVNYDLISISGGLKNNAIPREAEATINLDSNDEKQVVNIINNMSEVFKMNLKLQTHKYL